MKKQKQENDFFILLATQSMDNGVNRHRASLLPSQRPHQPAFMAALEHSESNISKADLQLKIGGAPLAFGQVKFRTARISALHSSELAHDGSDSMKRLCRGSTDAYHSGLAFELSATRRGSDVAIHVFAIICGSWMVPST
ncbi:hypothetical protein Vi05172_g92 [Venturia inaequalis]|nr:hypothetical protein Vi05172_g92 [Venturia inaequalis]